MNRFRVFLSYHLSYFSGYVNLDDTTQNKMYTLCQKDRKEGQKQFEFSRLVVYIKSI